MSLATILSQTATVDMSSAVSILSATNTLQGFVLLSFDFTSLHTDANEITLVITRGGKYYETLTYSVPASTTSATKDADPIYIGTGEAIAITAESSNAGDTAVVATVTGRAVEPLQAATRNRDLVIDASGEIAANNEADIAAATRTELATELARIDATISSRSTFDHATHEVTTDTASRNASKATGFSTHSAADVLTAFGTGSALTDCHTATGFSTHSAADVWSVTTRVLTAGTNLSLIDAAGVRDAVGLASANLDTQLGDIPTTAEFEARTILAGAYFDPSVDTVARVTLVDTTTANTDMRGTDNAALATTIGTPADTDIATDIAAVKTDTSNLVARLGAWTGSGINTVLGAMRALAAKAAGLTPTDISTGTTFDNEADSNEAIADSGASGGATAEQVWEYATRTLTAGGADEAAIIAGVVDGLESVTVNRISPYNPIESSFVLIQDDDYIYANGTHADISLVGEVDIDLTTATATLSAASGSVKFTGTATIVGAGGATPVLRLEWPNAGSGKSTDVVYTWQAKVLDAIGNKKTEFCGPLSLRASTD